MGKLVRVFNLPSAADLSAAFFEDLGNLGRVFGQPGGFFGIPAGQIGHNAAGFHLYSGSSNGSAFVEADQDYTITSVVATAIGNWVLSPDPSLTTSIIGLANNTVTRVVAAQVGSTTQGNVIGLSYPWLKGIKLYLNAGSGLGVIINVTPGIIQKG